MLQNYPSHTNKYFINILICPTHLLEEHFLMALVAFSFYDTEIDITKCFCCLCSYKSQLYKNSCMFSLENNSVLPIVSYL